MAPPGEPTPPPARIDEEGRLQLQSAAGPPPPSPILTMLIPQLDHQVRVQRVIRLIRMTAEGDNPNVLLEQEVTEILTVQIILQENRLGTKVRRDHQIRRVRSIYCRPKIHLLLGSLLNLLSLLSLLGLLGLLTHHQIQTLPILILF